jgi:hypothetical protein
LSDTTPRPADAETLELLTWISSRPRNYAESIDAWKSNCPHHAVWDDAVVAGLIRVSHSEVTVTPAGRALLEN